MNDSHRDLDRLRELLLVRETQQGQAEVFRVLVDAYERRLLYFIRRGRLIARRVAGGVADGHQAIAFAAIGRGVSSLAVPDRSRQGSMRYAAGVAVGYFWYFSKQRLSRSEDDRKVGQIAEINHKLDELTRRFDAQFGSGPAKEDRS